MYFYGEQSDTKFDGDISRVNGSKVYLRHFDNYLFLNFVSQRGTRAERAEVEAEILICERKMKFWERHPRFDAEYVRREKERKIKEWRQDKAAA